MVTSCLLQGASLGLLPRLTCSCPRAWLCKSSSAGGGGGRPVSLAWGLAGHVWRATLPPTTVAKQVAHVQWQTARPYGNDAETGGTDRDQHETAGKPRKKTPTPPGKQTVSSIGRRIDARVVHLVDENGTDLGHVHRANAIRMMEERGLKLVALREDADPPLYQLMSGKQIYNEQLKLRQKQQDKPQSGGFCIVIPRPLMNIWLNLRRNRSTQRNPTTLSTGHFLATSQPQTYNVRQALTDIH